MLLCVVLLFFFLLHYNTSLRNRLDIKQTNLSYNLAARFQAAENARSLRLAIFVFSVICCIFAVAISMMAISMLNLFPDYYDSVIMIAFECLVSLNPLFVVPAAMCSVPEWKNAFYKHMPFVGRRFHRPRRRPDSEVLDHELRVSMETNLYFVQLEDSWNYSVL
uniref:G_PROTEIN_RECEP_F1_2 domain-containing protein n=1 Tax=Caenorhabditis tropicalis TaxID=1561998 RepID=A0A1I7TPI9_9PELO